VAKTAVAVDTTCDKVTVRVGNKPADVSAQISTVNKCRSRFETCPAQARGQTHSPPIWLSLQEAYKGRDIWAPPARQ